MARGLPSMTALLGLLAIAGYQNRDKLAEMFGNRGPSAGGTDRLPSDRAAGTGGLGGLLGGLSGQNPGSVLSGGLGDLVERFRQRGHGDVADSWVGRGPNRQVDAHALEEALGKDVIDDLSRETGLSREELLSRLTRNLPDAVDRYTPEGRVPREEDFDRL